MNAQNFTYAFLAASALKQPFPAVMEAGATTADVRQVLTGDITITAEERAKMVKSSMFVGSVLTVGVGAVVYTVVSMTRKKRRK